MAKAKPEAEIKMALQFLKPTSPRKVVNSRGDCIETVIPFRGEIVVAGDHMDTADAMKSLKEKVLNALGQKADTEAETK